MPTVQHQQQLHKFHGFEDRLPDFLAGCVVAGLLTQHLAALARQCHCAAGANEAAALQ
jgi:hypothetical protein